MADKWERCRICGLEWPEGTRAECPQYRDAGHRRNRTNVRGQDVLAFTVGAAASPPEPPDPAADDPGAERGGDGDED